MLIIEYLLTLRRPSKVSITDFREFKTKVLNYVIKKNILYKRANKGLLMRKVIDSQVKRQAILKGIHDSLKHKSKKNTYRKITEKYF